MKMAAYIPKTQNDDGLDKRKTASTCRLQTNGDQYKLQNGDYFFLINFRAVIKPRRFLPNAVINKLASFVLAIYTDVNYRSSFQKAIPISVFAFCSIY